MNNESHTDMHADHLTWRSETNQWREELGIWQRQLTNASQALDEIRAALDAHRDALRNHAASLRLCEQQFAEHEHALAQCERGEVSEDLTKLNHEHADEAAIHERQRERHDRIKQHQRNLMAQWMELQNVIAEAV